jgi:hypothetical protein
MIAKLDSRGRLAIGAAVRKNGVEPSEYWEITYGTYGAVILKPAVMVLQSDQEVKWVA